MKSNLLGAMTLVLLLLAACTPDSEQANQEESQKALIHQASQRSVSPPVANLNVSLQHFEVQADQDKTIDLPNGTQIKIAAGTLVDKNGEQLTGPVDLAYREFHDAIDVFMSGIPMTYQTENGEEIFQTAGMMEINASQNGKEVFIAQGKSISIEMASFVEPPENANTLADDYQLYYLNESTGLWEDRGENNPGPNPRKTEVPVSVVSEFAELPMKPQKPSSDEVVFEFAVDYKRYPKLAPYDGISWQYANVETDEPGMINPNQEKWVFNEVWMDARVKDRDPENALYELQIRSKRKKARMIVTPVLEGEKYTQAVQTYEEIRRSIQANQSKIRAEQQRMAQQAKMVRAFSINQFGTYNCDRFYSVPNAQMVVADFSFPLDQGAADNKFLNIDRVFHLIPEDRAVITYMKNPTTNSWGRVTFSKSEKNYLVAMLPDNEVALFSPEDFASTTFAGQHTFEMKATGKKISSAEDLREMINTSM